MCNQFGAANHAARVHARGEEAMKRSPSAQQRVPLWPVLVLFCGCRGSVPLTADSSACPPANSRHALHDAYSTRFTVADGVVRITGEGTGRLLGTSVMVASETPRMDTVPNRLTGTVTLSRGPDTLWLAYDVISTPPQPASEIEFSGPFEITGGSGRFRCAVGSGTMSGSASLPARTGRNVFDGVVLTPAPDP